MPIELSLLHTIPLATWSALLQAHGAPRAPKSIEDVRRALLAPEGSLAAAVRTLRALSRDEARPVLREAARVLGVKASEWPNDLSTPGLVATLLTRVARPPKDRALKDVLRAAELALCRRPPVAPRRRYVGTCTREPAKTPAAWTKIAAAVQIASETLFAPGEVTVSVAEETPERLVLDVARPGSSNQALTRDAKGALTVTTWAPVEVDRLEIERGKGSRWVLWIRTEASELLHVYRDAAGRVLFDDPSLFLTAGSLSLCVLQRSGLAALKKARAASARMKDARCVSILWDPGAAETLTIDGRDVFAAVAREDLASHGRIHGARLRLDFDDGPVDVTLRVPNIVHWEPSAHDDAVNAFVDSLSLDEVPKENLVTLAPHDHADLMWRAALPAEVYAALMAKGMFVQSSNRALGHPSLPMAGRIMLAFALGKKGRYYVVPEEGFDAASWVATEKDLVTYRLDLEKLAAEIQRALGIHGAPPPRAMERGTLFDLGMTTVGTATVRFYLLTAARVPGDLGERLRARSEGAQPLVIVPEGMKAGTGCAEVEMGSLGGPYTEILSSAARVIGVASVMSAWTRAPKGTRLAVDRKSGQVWLDGVELVLLAESARALVLMLVQAEGKPVPGPECDRRLSGARLGTGAAKKAKARLVAGVKRSFALVGKPVPADVEELVEGSRLGYRVTVKTWLG